MRGRGRGSGAVGDGDGARTEPLEIAPGTVLGRGFSPAGSCSSAGEGSSRGCTRENRAVNLTEHGLPSIWLQSTLDFY